MKIKATPRTRASQKREAHAMRARTRSKPRAAASRPLRPEGLSVSDAVAHSHQDDPDISEERARAEARRLVINAVPGITRALLDEAKAGSYLHARMLFDFAALTAAPPAATAELSPIVKLLMDELELQPPAPLAS
jgi:hypothetical protein